MDLRHTDVVKYVGMIDAVSQAAGTSGAVAGSGMPAGAPTQIGGERSTRARIARLILENGPVSAAALSTRLGLTPAAIRRHLDGLLAGGMIEVRSARRPASRGRGRPAKLFVITDAGRSAFEHAYDDLATSALRFLAEVAGPGAVARVRPAPGGRAGAPVPASDGVGRPGRQGQGAGRGAVRRRLRRLCDRRARQRPVPGGQALTVLAGGEQLCQHHCPVAHVAAEFPQLCEAETEAFGRLLGTPVQRLATIAHGDGICTTHVTDQSLVQTRTATTSTSTTTTEPGGVSA